MVWKLIKWVAAMVIAMLIFSYVVDTDTRYKVNEFISKVKSSARQIDLPQDSSVQSGKDLCIQRVEDDLKTEKIKSQFDMTYSISEVKEFDSINEAYSYSEKYSTYSPSKPCEWQKVSKVIAIMTETRFDMESFPTTKKAEVRLCNEKGEYLIEEGLILDSCESMLKERYKQYIIYTTKTKNVEGDDIKDITKWVVFEWDIKDDQYENEYKFKELCISANNVLSNFLFGPSWESSESAPVCFDSLKDTQSVEFILKGITVESNTAETYVDYTIHLKNGEIIFMGGLTEGRITLYSKNEWEQLKNWTPDDLEQEPVENTNPYITDSMQLTSKTITNEESCKIQCTAACDKKGKTYHSSTYTTICTCNCATK